jgi:hypothetical protein
MQRFSLEKDPLRNPPLYLVSRLRSDASWSNLCRERHRPCGSSRPIWFCPLHIRSVNFGGASGALNAPKQSHQEVPCGWRMTEKTVHEKT